MQTINAPYCQIHALHRVAAGPGPPPIRALKTLTFAGGERIASGIRSRCWMEQ